MYRPFEVLEELVRQGKIRLSAGVRAEPGEFDTAVDPAEPRQFEMESLPAGLTDAELFEHAMRDVRTLGWSNVPLPARRPQEIQTQADEADALRALEDFLRNGDMQLEYTPEYIEASVQPHGRLYLEDLRSGRFSVQAHLDLHGFTQPEARIVLEDFVFESVRAGFTCVRVIHGRGRHSNGQRPVLKQNIQRWLTTRRMARHVIAYTSARVCDGGGGAVYVLLRK